VIGFVRGDGAVSRQPIYGERCAGKIGYTERDATGREWLLNKDGRRLGRVLRYKPHQAPQAVVGLTSGTFVPRSEE
jgi:hypothetical protein